MFVRFIRFFVWLGRHELGLMIAFAAVVAGILAFVELANEVDEGDTKAFDRRVLLSFRNADDLSDPVGPRWFEEVARDITALGGVAVLLLLTAAVSGFLVLQGKNRAALFVIGAVGGGLLVSTALKQFFDRPRPDLVPHGSYVVTTSFPSGHSMLSAVAYLTLGSLLARVQRRRRLKAYLLLLAFLLTLGVGASRVYLGVHWPTDVLSGWTAGIVWALICWGVARRLQRRGQIEKSSGIREEEDLQSGESKTR